MFSKILWEELKTFIPAETYPALPCPYCNAIRLRLNPETFECKVVPQNAGNFITNRHNSAPFNDIKKAADDNKPFDVIMNGLIIWDNFKYNHGKFVAFLECDECSNVVAVTGSAKIPNTHAKIEAKIGIKAEHFSPPIPIFALNDSIPKSVLDELLRAFNYFHNDLPAAGAKLRRALEQMCFELGFKDKTLHRSIELMSTKYPEEGAWLQTLKLVGNEATHSDKVDELDILRSFEVFSAALDIFRRKKLTADIATTLPKIKQKFIK